MCTIKPDGILCTLWQCYCCGCIVPINIKLENKA